jgi:hypothetical protein
LHVHSAFNAACPRFISMLLVSMLPMHHTICTI